jgi:hypothetical protein
MSEEIIKIEQKKDITMSTYFTNVKATRQDIVNSTGQPTKSPWTQLNQYGIEAYGLLGNNNKIIELVDKVDGAFCRRKALVNEFEFLTDEENQKVVKGVKFITYGNGVFDSLIRVTIINSFMSEAYAFSGDSAYTSVFFEDKKDKDYNVSISLNRTIDVLNTLNVINHPLSEIPAQESETGVVMGTLYAQQKIVDENGVKVKIPLSNVPIIIFNKSDEFENISSVDDNGNRVSLNIFQNTNSNQYANIESFIFDLGKDNAEIKLGNPLPEKYSTVEPILYSTEYLNVPEKFKYSTITNENGEFILQNIPIGNQVLMFEVDLLKQGMTKDEVALNFFPYPLESQPNIDNIPHFYFRQIPISVTPSWGSFQTGYTQVDITTYIDMRKWCTFYTFPISVAGKTIEELIAAGINENITFLARDMTKEGYPLTNEIVEISEIFDRINTQRHEWAFESKSKKPRIEFNKNNFQAFKLPANLYDPNNNPSKSPDGLDKSYRKGVWLCSYQIKSFYSGNDNIYKTTGFLRSSLDNTSIPSSHFDLNRGADSSPSSAIGGNSRVGQFFPYEKPWTINYPEPYKIPNRPNEYNTSKNFSNKLEPRFLDGDMPGEFFSVEDSTGYGSMANLDNGKLIYNQFAKVVTKNRLFKYEQDVSWHEEFSNGFRTGLNSNTFPNKSFSVKNGEKYQRIESGFSYWLRPEGWGRVFSESWGDYMLSSDIDSKYLPDKIDLLKASTVSDLIPTTYINSMRRNGESLYIKFDDSVSPAWLQQGGLDIYRILDDTTDDLSPKGPPFLNKIIKIELQSLLRNNEKAPQDKINFGLGDKDRFLTEANDAKIDITNSGTYETRVTVGSESKPIAPGKTETFSISSNDSMILPANRNYNVIENYYVTSSYNFVFKTSEIINSAEVRWDSSISQTAGSESSPPIFYLFTVYEHAKGSVKIDNKGNKSCKDNKYNNIDTYEGTYGFNGFVFERTESEIRSIQFIDAPYPVDCTFGQYGVYRID